MHPANATGTILIYVSLTASCRVAAGGHRDVELLASLRSVVDSLTEELRMIDPAAKRQRINSNAAESSTAGDACQ
jgi:hypothetical protein